MHLNTILIAVWKKSESWNAAVAWKVWSIFNHGERERSKVCNMMFSCVVPGAIYLLSNFALN